MLGHALEAIELTHGKAREDLERERLLQLGLVRADQLEIVPEPDMVVERGDRLVVLARDQDLERLPPLVGEGVRSRNLTACRVDGATEARLHARSQALYEGFSDEGFAGSRVLAPRSAETGGALSHPLVSRTSKASPI